MQGANASGPFAFSTAASGASFTAAVLGDLGVNNSEATVASLASHNYNFTVHVGDISYADDSASDLVPEPPSGVSFEAVYDEFQRRMEPISSRAAYMVAPGNHDVTCHVTTDAGCPDGVRIVAC